MIFNRNKDYDVTTLVVTHTDPARLTQGRVDGETLRNYTKMMKFRRSFNDPTLWVRATRKKIIKLWITEAN